MMKIRVGTESDKQKLTDTYPYVRNVIGENGYLLLAENENETVGFLWAFKRKIPAPVEREELFINVIDVIHANLQRKGLGSKIFQSVQSQCLTVLFPALLSVMFYKRIIRQ